MDIRDFSQYLSTKLGLADGTVNTYGGKLVQYLQWQKLNNKTLSPQSIETFLYSKKDKPNTINIYIYLFKHLEDYLKDRGKPLDLTSGFKPRKTERAPIQILSVEEVKRLINTTTSYGKNNHIFQEVSEQNRILTKFLYLTCCRISEALTLTVEGVDLGGGWVTFTHTKGKKYRKVPIGKPLINDLKPYIQNKKPSELVFQSSRGTIIHKGNFWRDLQMRAKEAGITTHLHAHIFRHSGASHLILNNVPIELVSQILGHEDVGLTMNTYVHLKDTQLQDAMFRMPYYQETTCPKEIIKHLLQVIKSFKLDEDYRLNFKLEERSNGIKLELVAV